MKLRVFACLSCLVWVAACSSHPSGGQNTGQNGLGAAGSTNAGSFAGTFVPSAGSGAGAGNGAGGSSSFPGLDAAVFGDAGTLGDAASSAADGGGSGGNDDAGRIVPSSPGYLHTHGRQLLDHDGNPVQLTGINWFGMETSNYAPHGLWTRSLDSMLDQIVSLGYNMLRLPYCSQFFDSGSTPNGIDMAKNPGLQGKSGLALLDAIVDAAGKRGLRVVLDRHRPDSNAQSELWYTGSYSEQRWIDDWKMLATHYKGNSTVIGFDLHNEPHGMATWGDGSMQTDWRAAAERAGNAILAINSDVLIIVEGIEKHGGQSNWWGGNLRGAKASPVRLDVKERLVYSAHEYPPSVYMQPWFSASDYPNNLPSVWHDNWGYLIDEDIAPVWLGEFGTKYETDADKKWLGKLASYIDEKSLDFAYWCINPNSGDTGGILKDDWMTVQTEKQAVLMPLLAPLIP
ncbi:MAG TPA: glycoside hydrolase family 5 protein [Polyangiales bacterium]|nr:glycoside hydrolase family 5 protein [Polyangiales bacterium]